MRIKRCALRWLYNSAQERDLMKAKSPRVQPLFSNTLPHPNTAPKRSIFTARHTADLRITQKSVSISPPDPAVVTKKIQMTTTHHVILPPPPASGNKAPQKPRGPSPQNADIKQARKRRLTRLHKQQCTNASTCYQTKVNSKIQ